jgi:hypothetical protein
MRVDPAPDALLFTGRGGTPLRYNSWWRWKFVPAVTAAGLDGVTPHDLRATHGSWVADAFGVLAAAARLGHSNANVTTRHYARAADGKDTIVAAGLDELWDARTLTGSNGSTFVGAREAHDEFVDDDSGSSDVSEQALSYGNVRCPREELNLRHSV